MSTSTINILGYLVPEQHLQGVHLHATVVAMNLLAYGLRSDHNDDVNDAEV